MSDEATGDQIPAEEAGAEDALHELECDAADAAARVAAGARLIDVRTQHEFEAGRLAGAERIGLEDLADRKDELEPSEPVVFYCRVGNRSLMAAEAFAGAGFDAVSLAGGIDAWLSDGHAIEPDGGFVAEPGQAAAILEARSRAA
jgi:rhodanese-related sulfurtransferase